MHIRSHSSVAHVNIISVWLWLFPISSKPALAAMGQPPSKFIFVIVAKYRFRFTLMVLRVHTRPNASWSCCGATIHQCFWLILNIDATLFRFCYRKTISCIDIMSRCPSSFILLLVAVNIHPHVMYSYHGSIPIQTEFGIITCQYTSACTILLIWLNTHPNSLCYSAGIHQNSKLLPVLIQLLIIES